jgi:hypothetical protein
MLEKIRLDVNRVFSKLGLRPKPLGFKLRVGCRFCGPRLGSRPNFLGAALEPCLGLSSGVGCLSGQIVPQESAGLGSGSVMGFGCSSSALVGSTPPMTGSSSPMTSEVVAVPSFDFGLPVVAFVKVSSTMLGITATPVIIPLIPDWAKAVAMVSGSPHRWLLRVSVKRLVRLFISLFRRMACSGRVFYVLVQLRFWMPRKPVLLLLSNWVPLLS